MKLARNLFLGLALLVLLYGGVYRLFFREWARNGILCPEEFADPFEKRLVAFFRPVAAIDLRLTVDRPFRKSLQGRWLNPANPDDFVTITGDDRCRFRLGEYSYEGDLELDSSIPRYIARFQHEGWKHTFLISFNTEGRPDALILAYPGAREGGLPDVHDFYSLHPAP